MKKSLIKYLPDILIIIGILILSYNLMRPETGFLSVDLTNYHTGNKMIGIALITIGVDIVIRKYININYKK